jgi:hypothetical protein
MNRGRRWRNRSRARRRGIPGGSERIPRIPRRRPRRSGDGISLTRRAHWQRDRASRPRRCGADNCGPCARSFIWRTGPASQSHFCTMRAHKETDYSYVFILLFFSSTNFGYYMNHFTKTIWNLLGNNSHGFDILPCTFLDFLVFNWYGGVVAPFALSWSLSQRSKKPNKMTSM